MTQNHTAFPNITNLTLDMVGYNGGLHVLRTPEIGAEQDVENKLDEILGAEGIYHDDLAALDTWLGNLSKEDFFTVAAGEVSEVEALIKTAPVMGDVENSTKAFLSNIYEHCIA